MLWVMGRERGCYRRGMEASVHCRIPPISLLCPFCLMQPGTRYYLRSIAPQHWTAISASCWRPATSNGRCAGDLQGPTRCDTPVDLRCLARALFERSSLTGQP
jgi:hypothetical protein